MDREVYNSLLAETALKQGMGPACKQDAATDSEYQYQIQERKRKIPGKVLVTTEFLIWNGWFQKYSNYVHWCFIGCNYYAIAQTL